MNQTEEIRKLKVYLINSNNRLKRQMRETLRALDTERTPEDYLTIEEVEKEYSYSRKTIDRFRAKGLKVNQARVNGKILIQRKVLEKFINTKRW